MEPKVEVKVVATATELLNLKQLDVISMDELRELLGLGD